MGVLIIYLQESMDAPNGKLKTGLHGARSRFTLISLLGRHRALGTLPGKSFPG